jgi:hypothetical protein
MFSDRDKGSHPFTGLSIKILSVLPTANPKVAVANTAILLVNVVTLRSR